MSEPNPEKAAARKRKWYLQNREQALERSRRYRVENSDRVRASHRAWYLKNREKVRERVRQYQIDNRDAIRASRQAARAGNPEYYRARSRRYRHGVSPEDWAAMWAQQEGKCYLCGDELTDADAAIDHDHACCPPKTSCAKCRRGLAHSFCNIAVGYAGDDPGKLRRMADALEIAKADVAARIVHRGSQITLF